MLSRDLSRVFRPRSIAVIGGGAVSRYVQENCRKIGFSGPVWHVHPSKGNVPDIDALPEPPDVAFVGVNRIATLEIIEKLRDMGSGGAVAYASGFREAQAETGDGAHMQAQLLAAAGQMPLIGPNCYGFLNYLDGAGLWPDQQGGKRVQSGVAIITQSSNIAINLTMQRRGLPLAYVATAGNQAQIGLADMGAALLADPRVTALGLHIEGIGDIRAFEGLADLAHREGKPIVALKAGQSDQARAATISHTASLAGSAAGSSALFDRLGIAQVATLSEMLETLKILHVTGPLWSNRIASMSCSGGEASLMADRALGRDLEFPPLDAVQTGALRDALGSKVALANPLDYHTYIWADAFAMGETYASMMHGDLAMGVVVADFPRTDRCADEDWNPVIQGVEEAMMRSGKPMAILASLPDTMPEEKAEQLITKGIVPLTGMEDGLAAIEAAARLGRARATHPPILLPCAVENPLVMTEAEGKAALQLYGMPCPRSFRARGADAVAKAAESLGFPLVLKGEGIAHKTEAGAVRLGLASTQDVLTAARDMPTQDFLLEEMVQGGVVELLLGIVRDPAHGYVLTLAAGGVMTEILRDGASLLLPVAAENISAALDRLRIAPVIRGFRGKPGIDRDAVVAAVLALQDYVIAHDGRVDEVEINPLICTQTRAVAADVLIKIGARPE